VQRFDELRSELAGMAATARAVSMVPSVELIRRSRRQSPRHRGDQLEQVDGSAIGITRVTRSALGSGQWNALIVERQLSGQRHEVDRRLPRGVPQAQLVERVRVVEREVRDHEIARQDVVDDVVVDHARVGDLVGAPQLPARPLVQHLAQDYVEQHVGVPPLLASRLADRADDEAGLRLWSVAPGEFLSGRGSAGAVLPDVALPCQTLA
jgi:hypothetical protein